MDQTTNNVCDSVTTNVANAETHIRNECQFWFLFHHEFQLLCQSSSFTARSGMTLSEIVEALVQAMEQSPKC